MSTKVATEKAKQVLKANDRETELLFTKVDPTNFFNLVSRYWFLALLYQKISQTFNVIRFCYAVVFQVYSLMTVLLLTAPRGIPSGFTLFAWISQN